MKLPYTRTSKKLNRSVTKVMKAYAKFIKKAKKLGFDVRLTPNSLSTLELYFHDDYPNLILVDKYGWKK